MHVMPLIVLMLLIAGVVIWSFAPDNGRGRTIRSLAAGMFIVAGVLVILLLFFREPTCRALGGNWISGSGACQNEWGGNGTGNS